MLKKLFFITFIYLFYFEFFSNKALASCNFKTGNYIEELSSPKEIKNINIKVNKSKKYLINSSKTILSKSYGGASINPKYKKKFRSEIIVNYDFGYCKYKGKVWQNGDWKDHIKNIKGGKIIRSLNVKLDKGNILNATKFKLLIPNTRNGRNEILGSIILRELGFIAPETSLLLVSVNNIESKMIFQEDSQKELLERNNRREGPIYEGDESKIWTEENYYLRRKGDPGLETISLSRLINRKWFLKGSSSQFITLSGLDRLQKSYLEYSDEYIDYLYFINPNQKNNDVFKDYHFLILSMNGEHALRPHNRKYYFNILNDSFEPIYYDGNLNISLEFSDYINTKNLKLYEDYSFPYLEKINQKRFLNNIKKKFKLRIKDYKLEDEKFFKNSFESFISNANKIQRQIYQNKILTSSKKDFNKLRTSFLERNVKFKSEKNIIKDFYIIDQKVSLELEDGKIINTNLDGFSRIIARKPLDKKLYLFLPKKINSYLGHELINNKFIGLKAELIMPKKMQAKIEQEKSKTLLFINQNNSKESILIKNAHLKDMKIIFEGLKDDYKISNNEQRFNTRGLTGCLNIYDSYLENISIVIKDGKCEDSLNIINSRGKINDLKVNNAYQDAVDIDFSNISIDNININKAGNDCLDVSGGKYVISISTFENCSDKAISIGEKSKFNADKITINNSDIGIAVKDLSQFKGQNVNITQTKTCLKIFQKKYEFGGATAYLKNLDCSANSFIDKNSSLTFE